jgi:DNA processing protein
MNLQKINEKAHGYPQKLRDLASVPKQLYLIGNTQLLEKNDTRPLIAIIGSRNPTLYGEEVTRKFASELAAIGAIIVSGLALGIDAIAHKAVVDQGLPTIAVQARGLDEIYPSENYDLGKAILKNNGLIISEYAPKVGAYKQNFIARNRIVAALSDGVVVTEAGESSGTSHTVRFALETNRPVMAVPGPITSSRSAGTNNMIRAGAIPVTSVQDILNAIELTTNIKLKPIRAESREEQVLIDLMQDGISQSEELIVKSKLSASEFANLISLMEIAGKITNLGAGNWILRN